jgi:ABC-type nitrate/sulfonate/bicarbonate transport system substrate-binding protein
MKKSAEVVHGRTEGRQGLHARVHWLVALCLVFAAPSPALAEEPVRIGLGFGLAFLPAYICEDLKLIEKHGKESHLDLRASYQRFLGAGPLQDALASGAIDLAPFGAAPLLAAWEKAKDTPRQILCRFRADDLAAGAVDQSFRHTLACGFPPSRPDCNSLSFGSPALFAANAVGKGVWPI